MVDSNESDDEWLEGMLELMHSGRIRSHRMLPHDPEKPDVVTIEVVLEPVPITKIPIRFIIEEPEEP